MFTARLQAAMIRLATMMTSVMSWIIASRRAVDGLSASTVTGVPWRGKARSRTVRACSIALDEPFVATTTASTGSLASLVSDKRADGHAVDDACELCPSREERK